MKHLSNHLVPLLVLVSTCLMAQKHEGLSAWLYTENGDSIWLPAEITAPEEVWRSSEGLPFYGHALDVSKSEVPKTTHARIGAYCVDGSFSQSLKNGTCSGHKGVRWWFYQHQDSLGREDAQVVLVPGPEFQRKRPSSRMPRYTAPPTAGKHSGGSPPDNPPPTTGTPSKNAPSAPEGNENGQGLAPKFIIVFQWLIAVLAFVAVLLIIKKVF